MSFLPIVERELRVTGRRRNTYRTRFYAALSMIGMWLFLLVINRHTSLTELGVIIFVSLGVLALTFALLAGIFLTADCLSEEKREETLGLLFLTDLRGHDVVLGKLAATSLHAIYGLLAILPILGLPLLMGGVTGASFGRVTLALVATLFLSLSLGLLVSALCHEARQAMMGTFLGLLLLAGVFPALYWAWHIFSARPWVTGLLLPSPVYAFIGALDMNYSTRSGGSSYWACVEVVGGLAAVFLVAAALLLPRVWQVKPRSKTERAGPPDETTPPAMIGVPDPRRVKWLRARVARGLHPFLWLASRRPAIGMQGRIAGAVLLGLWFCFLVASIRSRSTHEAFSVAMLIACALHVGFKGLLALEATRQLSEDRQSGGLELLLVSPLPELDVLAGQGLAMLKRFAIPGVLVATVNVTLITTAILYHKKLSMNPEDLASFGEVCLGGVVALLADSVTLTVVGMWQAVRTNRHHRAVLATLVRVMLPSWIGIFVVVFLLNSLNPRIGIVMIVFGAWLLFGLAVDLVWGGIAWVQLRRGLRALLVPPSQGI